MVCGHFTSTSLLSFTEKRTNIKKLYNVISTLFFEHAIVLCFLSFFKFILFFGFWLLSIWRLGLFHIIFHYIIHKHFTCIFTYHISIFRKLNHFQVSKKNVVLRWRKKTKHMYDKPKEQKLPCNLKCKHLQK
jgi:hypothetical protein